MQVRRWFAALAPLTVAIGVCAMLPLGCGESVATCDSICALPDAPKGSSSCTASCTKVENACSSAACSAEFQEYLTCVGNAGTYLAVEDRCAAIATQVGAPLLTGQHATSDAGAKNDAAARCATATCASVCANDGDQAADCTNGCETTQAECSAEAQGYQALLTCLCEAGGVHQDAGSAVSPQCVSTLNALSQECPALGMVVEIDASTGHP